jgi:HSP20 family protein
VVARDWQEILQEMERWSKDLDRFMTHVNTRSRSYPSAMNYLAWNPDVNIYETADSLLVVAELAGVESGDIQIKYEGNRLVVVGQRRQFVPEGVIAVHRMEIQPGPFAFIVDLPWTVSAEDAEAKLEAGMLVIRLGKRNGRGGTIKIQTGSGGQVSGSGSGINREKEIAGGENDQ